MTAESSARLETLESRPLPPPGTATPADVAPLKVAHPFESTSERPNGHCVESTHGDDGYKTLADPQPLRITGVSNSVILCMVGLPEDRRGVSSRNGPMPKLDFSKFDGENPRLWRDRCEMCFEVFSVNDSLKTRFVVLNFIRLATSWLQTLELCGRVTNWDEFCSRVFDQFDKDQYQTSL